MIKYDGVLYTDNEIRVMQNARKLVKSPEKWEEIKSKVHLLKKKLGCRVESSWKLLI